MLNKVFVMFVTLIVSLIFSIDAFGQNRLDDFVNRTLSQADSAMTAKEYEAAQKVLLKFINRFPHHPEAQIYLYLGNAYYLNDQIDESVEAFEKGYQLHSEDFSLTLNYAISCYDAGSFQMAGELFEKAYGLGNTSESGILYQSAVAYFQAKKYDRAKKLLKKLLEDDDKVSRDALKLYTFICIQRKQFQNAETTLSSHIAKYRSEADFWQMLAHIRLQKVNFSGAAAAMEVAYNLITPSAKDWKELGNIYLASNATLKAARSFERAITENSSAEELEMLAKLYLQAHDMKKAIIFLDVANAKSPDANRQLEKGKIYYQTGEWLKAHKVLTEALKLDPTLSQAYLLLGICAWQNGNLKQAKKALQLASLDNELEKQAKELLSIISDIE